MLLPARVGYRICHGRLSGPANPVEPESRRVIGWPSCLSPPVTMNSISRFASSSVDLSTDAAFCDLLCDSFARIVGGTLVPAPLGGVGAWTQIRDWMCS